MTAAQPSLPHDELRQILRMAFIGLYIRTPEGDFPPINDDLDVLRGGLETDLKALILAQRQEAVREALERLSAAAETHETPIYGVTNRQIHDLLQTYLEEK